MLKGSIRLFRIRGIQLSVHVTFLLLLAYVGWEGWSEAGWIGLAENVGVLLAFFSCIVLHELGHSFAARAFGVTVPRILLLPIGGMAEFTTVPRRPIHEIQIALAGPAVNFAILGILTVFSTPPTFAQLKSFDLDVPQLLFAMNLMMGTFNLLPAFPMDGGRVLRALFAMRLPYVEATRRAVQIGKIVAVLAITALLVLPEHPHYMAIAVLGFIMIVGELEYRAVLREELRERWRELACRNAVPL